MNVNIDTETKYKLYFYGMYTLLWLGMGWSVIMFIGGQSFDAVVTVVMACLACHATKHLKMAWDKEVNTIVKQTPTARPQRKLENVVLVLDNGTVELPKDEYVKKVEQLIYGDDRA